MPLSSEHIRQMVEIALPVYALGLSSPVLLPKGPALLCCPREEWDQVFLMQQPERVGARSPTLTPLVPALLHQLYHSQLFLASQEDTWLAPLSVVAGEGWASLEICLNSKMTPGHSPKQGHPHVLWRPYRPQTLAQTPAMVGPGTQTRNLAASLAQSSPWLYMILTSTCSSPPLSFQFRLSA